jgi:hypothetical protein
MAKPVLIIEFAAPPPPGLAHRLFNFLEDTDRVARRHNIGALDEINRYGSGRFIARISASRHLWEMKQLITRLLEQHMLTTEAVVSRADGEPISTKPVEAN